jgi:hypothetical protein
MYRVNNVILNNLSVKQEDDKFKQSGRDFRTKHKEYIHNKDISKQAKNTLDAQHEYGHTTDILEEITCELFYTYKFTNEQLAINEQHTNQNNIFLNISLSNK